MQSAADPITSEYDVVVCGGSLAGAATALLLLRSKPGLRIAVVEKSTHFPRRVGEATVEVSAFFLGKVLGLTRHLNEHHLTKQGMRFWYSNAQASTLADCSEIGGRYLARVPSWQVDRSVLDEEVLRLAVEAGVVLHRPAKALAVKLTPGGMQSVEVEEPNGKRTLIGRWVVDASGFTALLARQEGWYRRNAAHPTTAVWARWKGVKDWDGRELATKYPEWYGACHGIRATATNHVVGDGWWSWWIPLKGGDTSVGIVFDQRLVDLPRDGTLSERLTRFLTAHHPVAKEMLEGATPVEGDVRLRANLAYSTTVFAGDGFVLTGDAAGFIDPLYSPGMDWLSYTTTRAVELILSEQDGCGTAALAGKIDAHNRDFTRSYDRWFTAIYQDKYEYLGDFELMRTAFRLDLGLYYLGVVSQPLKFGPAALRNSVFTLSTSDLPHWLMRTYNRRLVSIARSRKARGVFGRSNAHQRFLLNGFRPDDSTVFPVVRAVLGWLGMEVREGWRSWFQSAPQPRPMPAASTAVTNPA